MKKKKSLLVLLGILAALVMLYVILGSWNDTKEKEARQKEEGRQVWVTDMEDLTSIQYTNGQTTMNFVKEDGAWYCADNKVFPLSQDSLTSLAAGLSKISATRVIKDADDLKDYGLLEPVYTIRLADADGSSEVLYMGNTAGEDYYLTTEEKETVYTVAGDVTASLSFDLSEMMEVEEFPTVSADALQKAEITRQGKTVTYESDDKDDAKAIATIEGGLGAFSFTACEAYSVTEEQLAAYGLDEANRTTAVITYKDGDEVKTLTLYVGVNDESGTYQYVKFADSDKVNTASSEVVKNLLNEE